MHNPAVTKYDMHVISGGQTGVDLAGLRAAQCMGLKTGGLAPHGFKTTAGPRPQLKTTFCLEEGRGGYSDRTRRNVERAHATLILAYNFESSGTKLTLACAEASGKPVHRFQLPAPGPQLSLSGAAINETVAWLEAQAVAAGVESFTLNVAGNSSRSCPGIFIPAFVALAEIFVQLAFKLDFVESQHLQHFRQQLLGNGSMIQALNDNFDYIPGLDPRSMKNLVI